MSTRRNTMVLILTSVFLLIAALDGLIIGGFCYWIIENILGDKPAAKIVKRVIGIPAGIFFPIILLALLDESSLDYKLILLILAAPVIIYKLCWSSKKPGR